jgi:hypothetical protein
MVAVHTHSRTTIERAPEDVYEFVTTPANWVGTHPVTEGVKGDTGRSAGVGDHWTEVIRTPDAGSFDAEWTATKADPGKAWKIETDQLRLPGVRCEITYTFLSDGGSTDFRRDMVAIFPDEPAYLEFAERAEDPSIHDDYLAKVKAALER